VTGGPFADSWEEAERRSRLFATFHGYRPLVPDGDRIDWILTSPQIGTRVAAINTFERRGQFPSDHLPVQAVLRMPGR
jgi:endonuclease/exonuclease/phosphatase family metal-dependent hydrolase